MGKNKIQVGGVAFNPAPDDQKFAEHIYSFGRLPKNEIASINQDLNTATLSDKSVEESNSSVIHIPKRFTNSTVNGINNNVPKSKEELKKKVLKAAKALPKDGETIGDAFNTYMNSISQSTKGYKRRFGLKSKKWRDAYEKVYGKTRYRYNKTEYEGGKKSKKSRRKSKRKN